MNSLHSSLTTDISVAATPFVLIIIWLPTSVYHQFHNDLQFVGVVEGKADGERVGRLVGLNVGDVVGEVGAFVGLRVGEVGATVGVKVGVLSGSGGCLSG